MSGPYECQKRDEYDAVATVIAASQAQTAAPLALPRRLIAGLYAWARPYARRILPHSARLRLAGVARFFDWVGTTTVAAAFEARSMPLSKLAPVLSAEHFDGPVLLVNNALAWGGVERQIVYTLNGLQDRLGGDQTGLLCVCLGADANHDFYRSALTDYRGTLRNVVALEEARAFLSGSVSPVRLREIEGCISWMPSGPRDEVTRFLADFLLLRPKVVHAWQDALSVTAGIAARIAGVPNIIVAGRNVAPINFAYFRPYMEFGYRELANCVGLKMLNNSLAGAASYAQWLGQSVDRFVVLRNGIDTAIITQPLPEHVSQLRRRSGIPEGAGVVGSIFRLYDEKRPFLWIEAAALIAARLPDVHFVIFGTGPMRESMLSLARRRGLTKRFHLPGTIVAPEQALGLMDVFLLTSAFEGTPNVVLEAGLLGVPVVTTDAGGTAETINPGVSGFVSTSATADELARQVLTVLSSEQLRSVVRAAAPGFVLERFGLARMVDETLSLYGFAKVAPDYR